MGRRYKKKSNFFFETPSVTHTRGLTPLSHSTDIPSVR